MDKNFLKSEFYHIIHKGKDILDALLFVSIEGFLFFDLIDLKSAWLSSRYWEILGYDPEEMEHLESVWKDTIFEEDLDVAMKDLDKHSEEDNYLFDQFLRHKHNEGSTIWMRFRGIVLKDEQGKAIRLLCTFSDVSSSKEMEKKMIRLADEYESIFNGTRDAMFLIKVLGDCEFRYINNNYSHQKKTKISLEDIAKKSPQELLGKEVGDAVSQKYQKCVESRNSISYEEELDLPGGKIYWMTTLTPILENDEVTKIVGSATDITDRKILELELKKLANYDKLTELPNRRLFFERLERMIVESERDNIKFALLFIDLDGLKEINDNYGHEAGDQVLITAGKRLSKCIRKSDAVARMGGDEFAILLRNIEGEKTINNVVEKIHQALQGVMYIGGTECYVNSSIGVSTYPDNGKDGETLLRNADATMYEIKRNGKGGFKFFKDDSANENY